MLAGFPVFLLGGALVRNAIVRGPHEESWVDTLLESNDPRAFLGVVALAADRPARSSRSSRSSARSAAGRPARSSRSSRRRGSCRRCTRRAVGSPRCRPRTTRPRPSSPPRREGRNGGARSRRRGAPS
jgi:hypothetical protein